MKEKLFFLDSNGSKVSAILSTSKESNLPIIILCHGLNSDKDSASNLALEKVFLENNIATFRFDFFAHGESAGEKEDRTVDRFVDDILNAIQYLKSKGCANIGIVGASFGSVAAVIAASKNPDLKVIALKAPGMGKSSRQMPNYKKDFDSKSWINAGKKIQIPTIIVHGTADEAVEVELGKELAKSIKNSQIKLFKDADHRFTKSDDFEKMIQEISEFIIRNIQIPKQ